MATTKESPQVTIDGDVDSDSNGSSDPNNAEAYSAPLHRRLKSRHI